MSAHNALIWLHFSVLIPLFFVATVSKWMNAKIQIFVPRPAIETSDRWGITWPSSRTISFASCSCPNSPRTQGLQPLGPRFAKGA